VLCAKARVEQIRQRPKTASHRVIQIVFDDGMEQILQTREGKIFMRTEFGLREMQTLL
jgi:phage baseplate assembly protein W